MAVYDKTADAATAVTAWLAQFKVASSGAITYVTGSDTFHVQWMDRALQKIAWDFATSGDDEIALSYPNPSNAEAKGTMITLPDHTAEFGIKYEVNDEVMTYHFGGSVSQNNGDDEWYGLKIVGKTDGTVPIHVIQNNTILTSHWGNGKNQTEDGTLARIMIKGRENGADIDHKIVHVKLDKWGYSYATWKAVLDLGEATASVSSSIDPQNTSTITDVRNYDVDLNEGWNQIDLDGNGDKNFYTKLDWGTQGNNKAVYEYVKALLAEDSTDTIFGVQGKLWTGRVYDCDIDNGSGTWVQNESLSWGTGDTAGTGHLVAVDNTAGASATRLLFHLDTGVPPTDNVEITGNGGAKGTINTNITQIDTSPNLVGMYSGSWIGAVGIGFDPNQVTAQDSLKDLDGNTIKPPNIVPINGTINVVDSADDAHIILALKKSGASAIDYETYSCSAGSAGDDHIDVDAISADVPQHGWIGVLRTGTSSREYYEYDSWSGTRFNLKSGVTLDGDITAGDKAHHAIFYTSPTGTGTAKSVSSSLIYQGTPIDVFGWVRQGDPAAPDTWQLVAGTIGSGGFAFTVNMKRAG